MQDTKALRLLKSLNKDEFLRLGKFLRSPFYNYSKTSITLYEHLKKYYPAFNSNKLEKEKIWSKLFPNKPFNENSYWKLCFSFYKLLEKYLMALQMEAQPNEEKKILIRALGQRNVYDFFEKETKGYLKKLDEQPWQDIHSYSNAFWLKHDYFFSPLTDKYGGAIYSVEDAMEELDRFYLLAKLRFAAEIKNRERMFSKKVPIKLLEECVSTSNDYVEENPTYLLYKIVLDLYDPEKAESAFLNGKQLLKDQFSSVSKHDQNEVMLNLRNYAIRELNKGRAEFWKELSELYKLGLDLDLVVNNGKISDTTFTNIVKIGCRAGQLEWVRNFIINYEIYLDGQLNEDAKSLSLSTLYFYEKKYDKSIDLINQHQFTHLLHQMDARILAIKARFHQYLVENYLFNLLISNLTSAEKYFRRNERISEQRKLVHLNFILAVKRMTELIFNKTETKVVKRKMEIYLNEEKQMASKEWLLDIIKQL